MENYLTGSAHFASPNSVSAKAHQIWTLATSFTYGGTVIDWLILSPLIFRRFSKKVFPLESTTCQCGAGVSGTTKSSESVSTFMFPCLEWETVPVFACGPSNLLLVCMWLARLVVPRAIRL